MANILNQELTSEESSNQYLSFHLDKEEYGIELLLVQEIVRDFKLSKVPNTNNVIQGMINFRGKVIPVLDVRAKFGLPTKEYDNFTVTIVLEYGGKNIGLMVDKVYDIVSLSDRNIQSLDEESTYELRAQHLKGMGKTDERLILLLDLEKVISFD